MISSEQTARADADSAIASDVTSLTTTVGNNTASISSVSSSVNGIEAKYGVEIDNNGSISGFQLLSGVGSPSAFNVRADQFNLFDANGAGGDTPFSIFTSSRTVDGVVFPAGTYIKDAYIDNASIVDGSITNAKIGGTLQSSNYSQGSTGWRIQKSGTAEFNGPVISRNIILASGSFTYPGTLEDGDEIKFVNSGIRMGANDSWAASKNSVIISAAIISGATAPSSFTSTDALWGLEATPLAGARWVGFNSVNAQPTLSWQQGP